MKLNEIFTQLAYGELSNVTIGKNEAGEIDEGNYKQIMAHVNLGLTELYKRFNLKEASIVVRLQNGQAMYPLNSKFAVNGKKTAMPIRWIIDTAAAPFTDNISKIERVVTDSGYEMTLNDKNEIWSCFTPSSTLLRVPERMINGDNSIPTEFKTVELVVSYRAGWVPIDPDVGSFDPARIDIELPYTHLNALLLFVASRVNAPIGLGQEFNASNNYYARFQKACQELEDDGFEIDQGSRSTGIQRNGWV